MFRGFTPKKSGTTPKTNTDESHLVITLEKVAQEETTRKMDLQGSDAVQNMFTTLCNKLDTLTQQVAELKEENGLLRSLFERSQTMNGKHCICNCKHYESYTNSQKAVELFSEAKTLSVLSSEESSPRKELQGKPTYASKTASRNVSHRETVRPGVPLQSAADAEVTSELSRKNRQLVMSNNTLEASQKKHMQVGVRNNANIKVVTKPVRPQMKSIFVTRFAPEVTENDITAYINNEIEITHLKVAKLKTKHDSYSSFYIAVEAANFERIFNIVFWPAGCLICPFYGKLHDDQLYTPNKGLSSDTIPPKDTNVVINSTNKLAGGAKQT